MWTVALSHQEHEEHTADEIVDLYSAGTIDADTLVWQDGMADWRKPFEIAELKLLLVTRGLTPRSSDVGEPPAGSVWDEPQPDPPSDTAAEPRQDGRAAAAQESESSAAERAPETDTPDPAGAESDRVSPDEGDWLKVFERPSLVDFSAALDSPRPRTTPPPVAPAQGASPPDARRDQPTQSHRPPSPRTRGGRPSDPPGRLKPGSGVRPPAPKRRASSSPAPRPEQDSPGLRPPAPKRGAAGSPPPRPQRPARSSYPPSAQHPGNPISKLDNEADIEPANNAGSGVSSASISLGGVSGSPLPAPDSAALARQPRPWLPRLGLTALVLLLLVLVVALTVGITRQPAPLYGAYLKVFGPIEELLR